MTKEKDKKPYRIEVSRVGLWQAMSGQMVPITEADLVEMAEVYSPEVSAQPFVVGHPKVEDPAFGWPKKLEVENGVMFAVGDADDIDPGFREMVDKGHYKKISLAYYPPNAKNNPCPGKKYPKHFGALGAMAPAVPNLQPMSFSAYEADDEVVEFSYAIDSVLPRMIRKLREVFIELFGKEKADEALPGWEVDTLQEEGIRNQIEERRDGPHFSETPNEENTMTEDEKNDLQAKLDAERQRAEDAENRLAQISKSTADARDGRIAAFCEQIVKDKKAMPAVAKKIGELLRLLPENESFSFAEGGGEPGDLADVAMEAIAEFAEGVTVKTDEEQSADDGTEVGSHQFASHTPSGHKVDDDRGKLYSKAKALAAEEGIQFAEAVQKLEQAS